MIRKIPPYKPDAPIIVVDLGNTTTTIATWRAGEVKTPVSTPSLDEPAFHQAFKAHSDACPRGRPAAVVVASVVPKALDQTRSYVLKKLDLEALVVRERIPMPLEVAVDDAKAIGVDRVCAAAAAYDKLRTACTIVDFGSAVTVDLVDDGGTLVGGSILPGVRLQLRALHEYTAVLPEVDPDLPDRPYGRNTGEAIQTGVCRGLAGAVRGLVEGYATWLNRWPQVVATGGDLEFISPQCDFLDTLVPDLTLQGIGLAYRKHFAGIGA